MRAALLIFGLAFSLFASQPAAAACYLGECDNGSQPAAPAPAPRPQASQQNYANELTDFGVPPQNLLQSNVGTQTPTRIPGARVITTSQLANALQQGQQFLLVDAWDDAQHAMLPGAVRITYAGRPGSFNDNTQRALRQELNRLTAGASNYPIVFYRAGAVCWESYNAALRAVAMGFSQVYWYRGGYLAWQAAGLAQDASDADGQQQSDEQLRQVNEQMRQVEEQLRQFQQSFEK